MFAARQVLAASRVPSRKVFLRCTLRDRSALLLQQQQQQQPDELVQIQRRTFSSNATSHGGNARILMLNNLQDNPGARRNRKRVGRGPGSGKGKTCGHGHKGQKPRRSTPIAGFEGGQTPFHKRVPKRGMNQNRTRAPMNELNLDKLQEFIDQGRIDSSQKITMNDLNVSNVCGKIKHGVKILGNGSGIFKTPINIEVTKASKSAIEAIEAAGGRVKTVYYNRLALRALLKPEKFDILPRRARPPPKILPYYLSFENRGEFSPEMQLSEAPFTEEAGGVFPSDPKKVREMIYVEDVE